MSSRTAVSCAALLCAATVLGCSSDLPVSTAPNVIGGPAELATTVQGVYELSFLNTSLQPVTSLAACSATPCSELVLGAHVESTSGTAAQSGSVTFQYCSYRGGRPNNTTAADEAPSSACADGSAAWKNLLSLSVNASGDAFMDFGIVRIPRTIGFRFKFSGRGSGIASGTSEPADFTWF